MRSGAIAGALCAALLACPARIPGRRILDTGEFGEVEILTPARPGSGLAIVFTGAEGIGPEDRESVARLVEREWAVALIDTRSASARLGVAREPCAELAGALEWLSRTAQNALGFSVYREPLLLGRGSGAALARRAFESAPVLSFGGGLGVDPEPLPPLPGLCAASGAGSTGWRVAARGDGSLADLYVDAAADSAARGVATGSLADLPLVELRAARESPLLAVFYSGDGGWRDLDKTIGEWLAAHGVDVVGVDTLRYFWSRRDPDASARDLARILEHYAREWRCERFVLIGYSFGANVLPFLYNRLPESLRSRVELVSLLAPARAADFEVHLEGWLGAAPSQAALPVLPEISRIDRARIQCLFGADEADESLCTAPELQAAERIRTAGSHHFDERYEDLALRIRARLREAPGS